MTDDLTKLAQQAGGTVVGGEDGTDTQCWSGCMALDEGSLSEFARLIRADMKERCLSAVRDERLVDAINCDADHAYNSALRDAEDAIRAMEE